MLKKGHKEHADSLDPFPGIPGLLKALSAQHTLAIPLLNEFAKADLT
jgi:hypothetical protein